MPEYTGKIEAFTPPRHIKVGGVVFLLHTYLYTDVARRYKLGDRVQVSYQGEMRPTGRRVAIEAKAVIRRTDVEDPI